MFPLVFPTLTQHFSVTCCFEFDGLLLASLYHATFCRSIDETLKKWQIDSEPFTGRRSKLAAQERDREKEREKFRLYRKTKDERLREELISEYRPLAEYLARQFVDSGEPLEDLIQYALIGLIKAIEGYDPDRGVEFTTYAWYQIRGEISHYLRDQGKLISEPAWLQEARIKIERARNKLRQTLKREPIFEELVQETGLRPEVVRRVLETEQLFKVAPLDETPEEEEEGVTDLERLVVEDEQVDIEQRYLVRRAVEQLPELHRKVIEWLFWEDLTMTEIARLLGVSVTYVSYLYRQAIGNLRRILGVSSSEPPGRKKRRQKKSEEQS
jgi:RNA polymerase sigma-B factor